MKRRGPNKNSKKVLMVIAGIVVLIVAVAVGVFMSKGDQEELNDVIDIKESSKMAIEQKVEYGDNIEDKTFTVHTEDETKEAKFVDLDPEVDTMTVGKTEHQLELEDEILDVTVIVEDTQKPVIKGVKDVIELEDEEVDVEKELKKLISAGDPFDGELDVVFEIKEDKDKENNFNVTAEATDVNDNKTTKKFKVVVKVGKKEEKEEKADKKEEEDKSSSVVSKSENDTSKPKKENPKQEKSKEEKPKQEKAKEEKAKEEKPKQEKPKEEKPKPESNPNEGSSSGLSLGKPVSPIPEGASVKSSRSDETTYSYNNTLPGGGKINEVSVFVEGSERVGVMVKGLDNDGEQFMGVKDNSGEPMYYIVFPNYPVFENDDYLELDFIASQFLKAYGH